jgi:hypothetical protein
MFLYSTAPRSAPGPTQASIQWVARAVSIEVKQPGREANHSPPSSAEVNNGAIHPPPHASSWCGA